MSRLLRPLSLVAIGLAAAMPAWVGAQGLLSGDALHWRCWMSQGERLACVLDTPTAGATAATPMSWPVPAEPIASTPAALLPAVAPAPASATQSLADRRGLPPIVARLREQPQTLAGQVISIPVFSVTDDWNGVTTLARAVLCSSSRACEVRVGASLSEAIRDGLDTDRVFVGPDLGVLEPRAGLR